MARALCSRELWPTVTPIPIPIPRLITTTRSCRCKNRKRNYCTLSDAAAAAGSGNPSNSKTPKLDALQQNPQAAEYEFDPTTKPNSLLCDECDGNGNKQCSQCKGKGVNLEDLFNGQFKAGSLCWLCGGKKEILCGNCNGAGFIGGFMSTFDP